MDIALNIIIWPGSNGLGLNSEIEPTVAVCGQLEAASYQGNGSLRAMPQPGTLHALPYAGSSKYRVGEIFCETFHSMTGARQQEHPR